MGRSVRLGEGDDLDVSLLGAIQPLMLGAFLYENVGYLGMFSLRCGSCNCIVQCLRIMCFICLWLLWNCVVNLILCSCSCVLQRMTQ